MMKYYAYYNHGGYKDFYLGDSEDTIESRYFLPLLKVHEESLQEKPDATLEEEVKDQKKRPELVVLSDKTDEYNYPIPARILMSHAGYKIMYRRVDKTNTVLAIRDILGIKDTYGRQSPFSIMFISNTEEDDVNLNILAEYVRLNLTEFENTVMSLFVNDMLVNGLRFDIGKLNFKLKQIFSENGKLITDKNLRGNVHFVVIPDGLKLSDTYREQNFTKLDLNIAYNMDGTQIVEPHKDDERGENSSFTAFSSRYSSQSKLASLLDMLNVPKLEDIDKLKQTIVQLETRITMLEERTSNLENK